MSTEMMKILNRAEIRRLERAAREKDKKHLVEWALQFEEQLRIEYEKNFQDELGTAVEDLLLVVAYSLHFSEETRFGLKRVSRFIDDLIATTEGFRTGEYNPEDYKKQLEEDGIIIFNKGEKK